MAPGDVRYLVVYIMGLIGDITTAIGDTISTDAADAGVIYDLTIGVFGENGGLIYWLNDKLLWLMEQLINGLSATNPL